MEFNELILKVTSCCNLNCRYCYVFNQGDNSYMSEPPVMSPRLIHSILFRINEHCRKHNIDEFLIIFHGGEPLMASKSFYTHFIKEADKIVKNTKLLYGLQTNATLLSQEWIDLFQKLDISIGVSIDGPRDASINRVYRNSGRPAYDSIIAGINLLKANNLPVNILSVINTSSDPHEVYAHLQDIGVEFADFLFPDVTYDHGGSPKTGEWLCQLFDLWYDDESDRKPIIRYLDSVVGLFLGVERGYEVLGRKTNRTISIKPNGNLELVDNLKVCGNGFTHTGMNIVENSFDDIANNAVMRKYYYSHSSKVLCKECLDCDICDICGGGNLAHRYSKHNGFNNPSVYCKDIRMLCTHIQHRLSVDLPTVFNSKNIKVLS